MLFFKSINNFFQKKKKKKIFFAGEHVSYGSLGTALGAYTTGIEAANDALGINPAHILQPSFFASIFSLLFTLLIVSKYFS